MVKFAIFKQKCKKLIKQKTANNKFGREIQKYKNFLKFKNKKLNINTKLPT